MATKTGVPIIPIALRNTHEIFEEQKRVKKTAVQINIGKPIETKHLDKDELKNLPKTVEDAIRSLMQELIEEQV